ncbi:MAG: hypothetical protein OXU61_10695 [Gammaproteobacteria bacterium]|nr:hypothetical protein [Gammaproteobacteria bacterium]
MRRNRLPNSAHGRTGTDSKIHLPPRLAARPPLPWRGAPGGGREYCRYTA